MDIDIEMSAFGGKADLLAYPSERLLVATPGHSDAYPVGVPQKSKRLLVVGDTGE